MPPPSSQPREPIVGPENPEAPFPLRLQGKVIKGFGRGSKELGIPTANIPISGLSVGGNSSLASGIYFGWAGLDFRSPPTPLPGPTDSTDTTNTTNISISSSSSSSSSSINSNTTTTGGGARRGSAELMAALAASASDAGWAGHGRVFPMVMSLGYNPFYKNTVRSVEVHILHDFARDFYGARLSLVILGYIRPEYDYVSKESLIEDIRTDIRVAARSLARPGYVKYRQDRALVEFEEVEDEEVGGEAGGEKGEEKEVAS